MKFNKITSINNELIKYVKRIYENQNFAKKNNLFVIEKAKLIFEAIDKNIIIKQILITENELKNYKNKLTKFINSNLITIINSDVAKYLSININHTEIFALCEFKIDNNFDILDNENYLLVDNVQDPGNLGTIIRTAFGLGIDKIFLYNCVYLFNNKCTKSCCGANFNKNIYIVNNISKFMEIFKNFEIICTSLDNDSHYLDKQQFLKTKNLIVVGNEGHGINNDILKFATKKIKLKMSNNIESFNVAIFTGIICFKILHN